MHANDLTDLIQKLEIQRNEEWVLVKEEVYCSFEKMKPLNFIKSEIKEFVSSPTLKHDLVNAAIGLTTGILVKKLVVGKSDSAMASVFGLVTEFVVANQVGKNADYIKSFGGLVLKKLFPPKEQNVNQ